MYTEVIFKDLTEAKQEEWIAILSENNFYSFMQNEQSLHAYILTADFDAGYIDGLANVDQIEWESREYADENWNTSWEANFSPITVGDFVYVRAFFHPKNEATKYEVEITPKMSFGTGHHATTFLMMEQMQNLPIEDKAVLDFGTGSGILAILAAKMGAASVCAIDNDTWSVENSAENMANNGVSNVQLLLGSTVDESPQVDILLANIIRSVLVENMPAMVKKLKPGGQLLLSGLMPDDEIHIHKSLETFPLELIKKTEKDGWLCLWFG